MTLAAMMNQFNWSQENFARMIRNNRLDGFTKLTSGITPNDKEKMDILSECATPPQKRLVIDEVAEQIPTPT